MVEWATVTTRQRRTLTSTDGQSSLRVYSKSSIGCCGMMTWIDGQMSGVVEGLVDSE